MTLVQRVATKSYGRGATTVAEGVGVTSVSPNTGDVAGGTNITITGTNFSGSPTVTVGGVTCTNIVVVNGTTITATTGAHAAGVVSVVVAGSGTNNNLFTYTGITVNSISPNAGSVGGGSTVTITGSGFSGSPSVTIGGNAATSVVVVNSTTITCVTAAHAVGVTDVIVDGVGTGNQLFTFSVSPTLIFASAFTNGTGTSGANPSAVNDGNKWDGQALVDATGSGLEVVASTGLDFPSTNVLKVTAKETGTGFLRIFKDGLSTPGENESIWYRCYVRHMQPLSQSHFATGPEYDEANHPVELGWSGDEDLTMHCETFSDTQWRIGIGVTAFDGVNFTYSRWYSPLLDKETTYRFEWQVARLTGLNFNLHCRVYNSSNELLYDDDDFRGRGLASSPTLADNPTLLLEAVANLGELCAGLNGLGGTYWYPSELYQYQGCFAVSRTEWCGVYIAGEGP